MSSSSGSPGTVTVTFIGNATTLISTGDVTLLTDPNFLHQGQYAYLGYGLVSKRLHEPALGVQQLPAIDAGILAHMHGDHWDRVTQNHLDHAVPVLTTHHAAKRLRRRGFAKATGMSTWQSHILTGARFRVAVTALPGRDAPRWTRRLLPPLMGAMLEIGPVDGGVETRVYISGDILLIDELADIPGRFEAIPAGVLHLGGTRLRPPGHRRDSAGPGHSVESRLSICRPSSRRRLRACCSSVATAPPCPDRSPRLAQWYRRRLQGVPLLNACQKFIRLVFPLHRGSNRKHRSIFAVIAPLFV